MKYTDPVWVFDLWWRFLYGAYFEAFEASAVAATVERIRYPKILYMVGDDWPRKATR